MAQPRVFPTASSIFFSLLANQSRLEKGIIYLRSPRKSRSQITNITKCPTKLPTKTKRKKNIFSQKTTTTTVGHAPKFVHQPGNELVKVGEPKTIECPVEAEPEPEIRWFKDGQLLSSRASRLELTGNELMFISISEQDSGEYFCQATNLMGTIESERFKLTIQTSEYPPFLAKSIPGANIIHFTSNNIIATSTTTTTTTHHNNECLLFFIFLIKSRPLICVLWWIGKTSIIERDNEFCS